MFLWFRDKIKYGIWHKIKFAFLRWFLKNEIAYVKRMVWNSYDNADIRRDGKSPDYWEGKRDGMMVGLSFLADAIPLGNDGS